MKSLSLNSALLLARLLAAAALSLGSISVPAQDAHRNDNKATAGGTFEGEIMDNHCAQMGSHEMTMKENKLATPDLCVSYCMHFRKTPDKYVLYNVTSKMIYQLDDQNLPMFFGGRNVRVSGTYNPATKTIHVKDITGASAS